MPKLNYITIKRFFDLTKVKIQKHYQKLKINKNLNGFFDDIFKFMLNGFLINSLAFTLFKIPIGLFEIVGFGALYHYLIEYPLYIVSLKLRLKVGK